MYCSLKALYFNVLQRTLTDIRDGETYRVRKLADGNVWMTENLRLVFSGNYVGKYDSSNNTITATTTQITPANSDVTTTWLPNHTTQTTTGTKWASISPTPEEIDTPHSYYDNNTSNTYDGEAQKNGSYYNFVTATAGIGTYSFNTTNAITSSTICPKGFTIPITNNNRNLILTYLGNTNNTLANSAALKSFPFSINTTGVYEHAYGGIDKLHRTALWTKQVYSNPNGAVNLLISTGQAPYLEVASTPSVSKPSGFSIRCFVKS